MITRPRLSPVLPLLLVAAGAGSLALAQQPGDRSAAPRRSAAMTNPEADLALRREALEALRRIGSAGKAAVPVLIAIVEDPTDPLRREAIETLGRLGSAASPAVPALIEVLRGPQATAAAPPVAAGGPDHAEPGIRTLRFEADWREPIDVQDVVADVVEIVTSSGGSARLRNVEADRVVVQAGGGSSVTIDGLVDELDARISGGSGIDATDLDAGSIVLRTTGGSRAIVRARDELDVRASGSSTVRYVETGANLRKSASRYSRIEPLPAPPAAKPAAESRPVDDPNLQRILDLLAKGRAH